MLQRRFLPKIASLIAFESAVRHGSVSGAADELNLTQSAVSRQILQLEATLHVVLFNRIRKRMVVTDAGRLYLANLRPALEGLSEATHNAMAFIGTGGFLNLAVMPTFATRWLIPRLPEFLALYPDVTINFTTRLEPFDFAQEPFDAAIHFGSLSWAGTISEHLMDEEVVLVCSSDYQTKSGISTPGDLANATLLQQTTRPTIWADWFQHAGIDAPEALKGHRFEQFAMIEQAAAVGMGVALLPRFVIEDELTTGRLRVILPHSVLSTAAYYIVCPEAKAEVPIVRAFRSWIVAQARTVSGTRKARPDSRDVVNHNHPLRLTGSSSGRRKLMRSPQQVEMSSDRPVSKA